MRIRVGGAVSDLLAADGQYHKDCMSLFRGPRNLKYSGSVKVEQAEDEAFTRVVNYVAENRSRIWNSVELHKQYTLYQGEYLTRRTLLNKLSEHFGPALLVLSGTGVAIIVTLKSKASNVLKLVSDEEDDHDAAILKVALLW